MNDDIEKGDIVKLTFIPKNKMRWLDTKTNYCVTDIFPEKQKIFIMSKGRTCPVRMCDCEIVYKGFKLTGCLPQPEYKNKDKNKLFNNLHISCSTDKSIHITIKDDYTKQYLSSEYGEIQEKNYIQQDVYKKDGISEEIIVEDEEVLYIGDLPVDQNLTGEGAEKIQDKSKRIVSKCIEKLMEKI